MCAQCRCARKGRPRQPVPEKLPDDLYDYIDDPARRLGPSHGGLLQGFDVEKLPVVDDWPEQVPITEAEIEVFERYFGDVLDRLFGPIDGPAMSLLLLSQSDNKKP